jgi:hypothetical protein
MAKNIYKSEKITECPSCKSTDLIKLEFDHHNPTSGLKEFDFDYGCKQCGNRSVLYKGTYTILIKMSKVEDSVKLSGPNDKDEDWWPGGKEIR